MAPVLSNEVCQNQAGHLHHNQYKEGGLTAYRSACLPPSPPPSLPSFLPSLLTPFYTGNRTQALSLLGKCPAIKPHPKPHGDLRDSCVSCLELEILQVRSHRIPPIRPQDINHKKIERDRVAHRQTAGIAAGLETHVGLISENQHL